MQKNHLLIISIALTMGLAACTTAPPKQQGNICKIFEEKRSWYKAASKVERKWDVPIGLQLAIIRQESSFRAKAKPGRKKFLFVFPGARLSSAKGYAQALDGTWDIYQKQTRNGGARRSNFKDATDFIGWYAQKSRRESGIPTTDYYNQYLAYHVGQAGYNRGVHEREGNIKRLANSVASTAQQYDLQLAGCEKKLKRRGIPFIPGV